MPACQPRHRSGENAERWRLGRSVRARQPFDRKRFGCRRPRQWKSADPVVKCVENSGRRTLRGSSTPGFGVCAPREITPWRRIAQRRREPACLTGRPDSTRSRRVCGIGCAGSSKPCFRLILDGTVVKVRLDRRATNVSLPVVLGVRRDGRRFAPPAARHAVIEVQSTPFSNAAAAR